MSEAQLGYATTVEMLEELRARFHMPGIDTFEVSGDSATSIIEHLDQARNMMTREEREYSTVGVAGQVAELPSVEDMLEAAWDIIANAWDTQNEEWVKAAERWRDQYHVMIQVLETAEPPHSDYPMMGWTDETTIEQAVWHSLTLAPCLVADGKFDHGTYTTIGTELIAFLTSGRAKGRGPDFAGDVSSHWGVIGQEPGIDAATPSVTTAPIEYTDVPTSGITAMRWDGSPMGGAKVMAWARSHGAEAEMQLGAMQAYNIFITWPRSLSLRKGDWLIRNVVGTFSVMNAQQFIALFGTVAPIMEWEPDTSISEAVRASLESAMGFTTGDELSSERAERIAVELTAFIEAHS